MGAGDYGRRARLAGEVFRFAWSLSIEFAVVDDESGRRLDRAGAGTPRAAVFNIGVRGYNEPAMERESGRLRSEESLLPAGPGPVKTGAERLVAWIVPLLIVVLTALAFWPALDGEFLNWDDDKLLVNNLHYRGLGAAQWRWMFTTYLLGHYQPVNWVSFGGDYLAWGLVPFGYHLTNLLVFALGALVFYRLGLRLLSGVAAGRKLPGRAGLIAAAGLAALLYALHPLRVETVAWVTSRAYVLSGLFFLLSVLFYLRYAERHGAGRGGGVQFALAVMFFAVSLFSRANAVALPVVLLLLDVYPLNRLPAAAREWFGPATRRVWLEKIPFLILALVAAGLAHQAKVFSGTVATVEAVPGGARMAMGAYALSFYLLKMVWPSGLLPLYEKPPQLDPFEAVHLLSGALIVGLTVLLFGLRRRWRAGWVLWLYYLVMVAPVSGIVQIGLQMAADRYTQLACLGWALLAGAGYLYCWPVGEKARGGRVLPMIATVFCAVAVVGLVLGSRKQCLVWRDRETLWRTTLAANPHCLTALNNLTAVLAQSGRRQEALELTRQALELQPKFPGIHLNLGGLLLEEGRFDEAIEHFNLALDNGLGSAEVYGNLGVAWAGKGDLDRALEHVQKAVSISGDDPEAHYNLGIVYSRLGRWSQAEAEFVEVLRLRPDHANAAHNLEVVRRQSTAPGE